MTATSEPVTGGDSPHATGLGGDEAAQARRERRALLLHSATFLVGAVVIAFWVFCAIFGDLIAPYDPADTNALNKLEAPSADHLLGTDNVGRDVLSRVIIGSRDILIVAVVAAVLATVFGTMLGLIAGYFKGVADEVIMRIGDAFLAIPVIVVGLLVLAAVEPSRATVIGVITLVFTPIIARTVRAAVLSERELDYVSAARLRNERSWYILFAEILPNVMPPIIVEFTVRLGYAIFTVATLSFLGVGLPADSPDWGRQVSDNYGLLSAGDWWPSLFPALAIATLVIGVNLVADGIAQAFER